MTETAKTFERQKSRKAERPEVLFEDQSRERVPEHSLSFLSLRVAINRYPDTGESGDAYDKELTMVLNPNSSV
jgi:hypothetical protein